MDIDSAATFLASSILLGLGFIVVGIVLLVINNIFHKYWKPVQWSIIPEALRMPPARFAEQKCKSEKSPN
jgi:predicted small integral membrane protein